MSHAPRRTPWTDLRFLIGLVLIVTAVAGVWLIVATARQTAPVLQAARTITPGETLTAADFRVVEVGLGALHDDYAAPQDLAPGMIAARTVTARELLPLSATTDGDGIRTTTVVIDSAVALPASVAAGSIVELWSAIETTDDTSAPPRLLIGDAVVGAVRAESGVLGGAQSSVELVIPRTDVTAVLAAIADDAELWVVPVGAGS